MEETGNKESYMKQIWKKGSIHFRIWVFCHMKMLCFLMINQITCCSEFLRNTIGKVSLKSGNNTRLNIKL